MASPRAAKTYECYKISGTSGNYAFVRFYPGYAVLHSELAVRGKPVVQAAHKLLQMLLERVPKVFTYIHQDNRIAKVMANAIGFKRVGMVREYVVYESHN